MAAVQSNLVQHGNHRACALGHCLNRPLCNRKKAMLPSELLMLVNCAQEQAHGPAECSQRPQPESQRGQPPPWPARQRVQQLQRWRQLW